MAAFNKRSVYLDNPCLDQIEALRAHYVKEHGLQLTTGALLRRAVAELCSSILRHAARPHGAKMRLA